MRMFIFAFLFMTVYAQVALAEEDLLLGYWKGEGRASRAIYGTMHISKTKISWGGNDPDNHECKTTYTLETKYTDTTYPGNTYPLINGITYTIYKLKIDPHDCTGVGKYFQFAIPSSTNGSAYVEVFDIDNNGTGSNEFIKVVVVPKVKKK